MIQASDSRPFSAQEETLLDRDRLLLEPIARCFSRARAESPEGVECHAGCSSCCAPFFEVTALDVWRIWQGLPLLHPTARRRMLSRAHALVGEIQALTGWRAPYDCADLDRRVLDRLPLLLTQESSTSSPWRGACPALDDEGRCSIYESRPRICRLQGLSYYDPGGGSSLPDFCAPELNFPRTVEPPMQPLDLRWQWEQERMLRLAILPHLPASLLSSHKTPVAGALVLASDWLEGERHQDALEPTQAKLTPGSAWDPLEV